MRPSPPTLPMVVIGSKMDNIFYAPYGCEGMIEGFKIGNLDSVMPFSLFSHNIKTINIKRIC